jgi:hypothetical protein
MFSFLGPSEFGPCSLGAHLRLRTSFHFFGLPAQQPISAFWPLPGPCLPSSSSRSPPESPAHSVWIDQLSPADFHPYRLLPPDDRATAACLVIVAALRAPPVTDAPQEDEAESRLYGFPSPVPFPLQLRRTIAINGLHSTPTGDLPRPLTSRHPRPIKGTLEHRPHTTFPFLASVRSIHAWTALPSSSVIAHLFPTVAGWPPAVHRPMPPSVRTPRSSSPFPSTLDELPPTGVAARPDTGDPFGYCHS